MSDFITIARPYAKAAFDFSKQHNCTQEWQQMLTLVSQVVQDDKVKNIILSDVKPTLVANLIIKISENKINDYHKNFIKVMAENKRLAVLPYVLTLFESYKLESESTVEVNLSSATKLTTSQLDKITSKLEQKLRKKINISCEIDKSIISGFIIRTSDMVINSSVKGRLNLLKDALQS